MANPNLCKARHCMRVTHECLETGKTIVERVPPRGTELPSGVDRFIRQLIVPARVRDGQGREGGVNASRWVPIHADTVREAIQQLEQVENEWGPKIVQDVVDHINAQQRRIIGPEEAKRMAKDIWNKYGKASS